MFSQERPPPCVLTLYAGNLPAPISSSCYIAMLCYLSCGHQQQFLPSWHSWSSLRYLSRPLSALHCERAMLCDTRPYICTNIYDTLYFFVAKKTFLASVWDFHFWVKLLSFFAKIYKVVFNGWFAEKWTNLCYCSDLWLLLQKRKRGTIFSRQNRLTHMLVAKSWHHLANLELRMIPKCPSVILVIHIKDEHVS